MDNGKGRTEGAGSKGIERNTLRDAALDPYFENVRAQALCSGCGATTFKIYVFECGHSGGYCDICGKAWEAPNWKSESDDRGSEAVGRAEDEPDNMVSQEGRSCKV
jgi:hypothetical protein